MSNRRALPGEVELSRAISVTDGELAAFRELLDTLAHGPADPGSRCPAGHRIGDRDRALGRCSACTYPRRLGGAR